MTVSCSDAIDLARLLHPAFRLHRGERSIPFNPQVWLSHQSNDSGRGSALVQWKRPTIIGRVGFTGQQGVPDLSKPATQAGGIPFDRNAISHINTWAAGGFKPLEEDWFVSFGGWKPVHVSTVDGPLEDPQNAGDIEYVNLMIEPLSFTNKHLYPNLYDPAPQPAGIAHEDFPTVWAELEWAGLYTRTDLARANRIAQTLNEQTGPYGVPESIGEWPETERQNFPPGMNGQSLVTDLDGYIALTYYLFFPIAAAPVVDEPGNPDWIWEIGKSAPQPQLSFASGVQEAHWEAITLFLAVRVDPLAVWRDPIGMPDFSIDPNDLEGSFDLDRSYIVASRGWKNHQLEEWKPSEACVRRLRMPLPPKTTGHFPVELLVPFVPGLGASLTPVVYTSFGSHRSAFDATIGRSKPITIGAKDVVGSILAIVGIAAAVVNGPATGPPWPLQPVDFPIAQFCALLPPPFSLICALIAALLSLILALLQILLALESLLTYAIKSFAGLLGVQQSWTPVTSEFVLTERGGITVVPSPQGVPLFDPSIAKIHSLRAATHVINSVGYSSKSECAPPSWWSFAGCWGIRVANSFGGWDNAGRRIDPYGRSKAYWNALALLAARQAKASCLEVGARSDGSFAEINDEFFPNPAFRKI